MFFRNVHSLLSSSVPPVSALFLCLGVPFLFFTSSLSRFCSCGRKHVILFFQSLSYFINKIISRYTYFSANDMGPFLSWIGLHVEFPAAGYLCWFHHLTALSDRCHIPHGYVGLYHILTAMNDVTFLMGMWGSVIFWRLWMTSHSSWACGALSYSDCFL